MKANFKLSKSNSNDESPNMSMKSENKDGNITKEEFEEFIIKSGASGSFMVFRSDKKEDELGLDEL
ncbi:MAG: hypothetical protein ACREBA_01425 [Nitrosotalea sp.]